MTTPNTLEIIQREPPTLFDPSETFIEASKLHRGLLEAEAPGIRELPRFPALVQATARATKPYPQHAPYELPNPDEFDRFQELRLHNLLRSRRSPRSIDGRGHLTVADIGWLCWATDGGSGGIAENRLGRTAPSGGALYPRDVYVSVTTTGDLQGGLYHYNPYEHQLEPVSDALPLDVVAATSQSDDLQGTSMVVLVVASFWRNRMKYGQRGVRFAVMEAGHVAQNCLLASAALGLTALTLGGFYDDEANRFTHADGLHENTLCIIAIGA